MTVFEALSFAVMFATLVVRILSFRKLQIEKSRVTNAVTRPSVNF